MLPDPAPRGTGGAFRSDAVTTEPGSLRIAKLRRLAAVLPILLSATCCNVALAASASSAPPAGRVAVPPPPRMFDGDDVQREESGATQATSQRAYCKSLHDQIDALPAPPPPGTPAPAGQQSERNRLEADWRKECG